MFMQNKPLFYTVKLGYIEVYHFAYYYPKHKLQILVTTASAVQKYLFLMKVYFFYKLKEKSLYIALASFLNDRTSNH